MAATRDCAFGTCTLAHERERDAHVFEEPLTFEDPCTTHTRREWRLRAEDAPTIHLAQRFPLTRSGTIIRLQPAAAARTTNIRTTGRKRSRPPASPAAAILLIADAEGQPQLGFVAATKPRRPPAWVSVFVACPEGWCMHVLPNLHARALGRSSRPHFQSSPRARVGEAGVRLFVAGVAASEEEARLLPGPCAY
jgi:fatty acid desaturase